MRLYLSSYKLGDNPQLLANLFGEDKRVAVITNALDFSTDHERRKNSETDQMTTLKKLGLEPELLDLRNYFGKENELKETMKEFGGVWIHGGNTFLLRIAYKLSGFDEIIRQYNDDDSKSNFIYAGFSAGCCVLQKNLKGIDFVDDPNLTKDIYGEETMWEGLGLLDFVFVPHFDSDHPESEDTNIEVDYYKKNNITYRTFRDGEVLII